ncbi:MAG TPA: hypothetical protein VG798_08660 [Rhizomicrobium sp.]|nr:hypothetical protein [Rhizomicrobium sp.]
MKRLISATLALSLLGATAASAAPAYRSGPIAYRDGYHHQVDNGAAIAVGVGFLALLAIMASQDHHRDYDRPDWHSRYHDDGRGYGIDRGGYGDGYPDRRDRH